MELHPPHRTVEVPDAHHDAVLGPRAWPEVRGQRRVDGQRVVADRGESLRQPLEQVLVQMQHLAEVAVARLRCLLHDTTLGHRDALMTQADAEYGDARLLQDACT